jgi:hypothetical protein
MSRPVRLDDEADLEIDKAVAWYEERLAGLGLEPLDEAIAAKNRLAASAATFPRVRGVPKDLGVRRAAV